MQVEVRDHIWVFEQWFKRSDGWEHCEIIISRPEMYGPEFESATEEGWTVTEYKRVSAS